jgi:hypothetical protein
MEIETFAIIFSPVNIFLVIILQQKLRQGARVTQALNYAVHVTSIAQVLQACQSAILRNEENK